MRTCRKCSKLFSTSKRIDGIKRNLGSRMYCLECSPFKRHNTQKIESVIFFNDTNLFVCQCGKEYQFDKSKGHSKSKCNSCITDEKRITKKQKAINHLGGKCEHCGYNKCIAALQFHHKNKDKIFNLGHSMNRSWKSILEELNKCMLLCANCHAEEHYLHKQSRLV